jgi:hypothetical protein
VIAPDNVRTSSPIASAQYSLRNLVIAGLIAAGVSYIDRRLDWPQPQWLPVAIVFFVGFALHPDRPGRPARGSASRAIHGLIAAVVAAWVYAMLSNW